VDKVNEVTYTTVATAKGGRQGSATNESTVTGRAA
jgi:hypothetical protein